MSLSEILKRIREYIHIYGSRIKYRNPDKWPYWKFAVSTPELILRPLPGHYIPHDWSHFRIYNRYIDLTKPINWYETGHDNTQWPKQYYATIPYRPGNPYGDIRINWELNRMQFLPLMASREQELSCSIIRSWLKDNPYLYGPSYVSSMEVALRWISIYRTICLLPDAIDDSLMKNIKGLAKASGLFIEKHLSTHSSAGNHIIVEAVGLFWIARALQNDPDGERWIQKARGILHEQILRQLNPDGSPKEQSFWYLGFVIDAVFHYFLMEDNQSIPAALWKRVERSLEFIHDLILPDGSYPDFGDRDDGCVGRINDQYEMSPFPGLMNIGSLLFNRPEWYFDLPEANMYCSFWKKNMPTDSPPKKISSKNYRSSSFPKIKHFHDCGLTMIRNEKGRLIFRHSPLGLEPTCGHGHADALSVMLYWENIPLLIDLGSGQYNGTKSIRDYFRSTIAHNTIEIERQNQAEIIGPFLWKESYECTLTHCKSDPWPVIEAEHSGYKDRFGCVHKRRIEWPVINRIEITDTIAGGEIGGMRGAFHIGSCMSALQSKNSVKINFEKLFLQVQFEADMDVQLLNGSSEPFSGWKSAVYGDCIPIYSILFTSGRKPYNSFKTVLEISEK
ncbi:MAG: alginate lyase family protein [Pseudomonadota bacterium]